MLLKPKQTRFKKFKKNYLSKTLETKMNILRKGFIGLKVLNSCRISNIQIEAIDLFLSKELTRRGRSWINFFPHISISKIAKETKMGKGKGAIALWCAPVKIGSVLLELDGISFTKAKLILKKLKKKLCFKTKIVQNVFK